MQHYHSILFGPVNALLTAIFATFVCARLAWRARRAVFVALRAALQLDTPPHFIVKTSEKKLHAYWLLKHCTVADFKTLQKSLAKKFGTDPSVCDPARAMPDMYRH